MEEKSINNTNEVTNDSDSTNKDDISKTNIRFYMLFLACLITLGDYFIYDNPAALETQVKSVIIN